MTSGYARLESAVALRRSLAHVTGRRWVTVGAFALVAGTGFASGGYFPASWGWPTLGAAWAAGLAVIGRDRDRLSRTATAAAVLLLAFTAWTVLSAVWSVDVTQTALEAERTAVFAAGLLAALSWAGRRPERLLHGTWAGICAICAWALLTRLVPDHFGEVTAIGGYRLSLPIGYWNTLGLMAALAALLGLGLAARARSYAGRAAAGLSLPPLATVVYFTYSRGAWIALGIGLLAMFLLDRRRLHLAAVGIAVAPWTALALYWAWTSSALTTQGFPLPEMAAQGHRLLLRLLLLGAVSAATAAALRPLEPTLVLPARLRPWAAGAVVLAVLAGAAAGTGRYGSPAKIARETWHSFASSPVNGGSDLNNRLFELGSNGRVTQWRVAWRQVKAHPWLGSGAATYQDYWDRHRPVPSRVVNVHNLYLETLADLGPLGLLLLAGALALPLAAAVRNRREPLVSAAFGAYAACLAHAAVDWDWEIASATLAFLLCGAMLLSSSRGRREPRGARSRYVVLATAVALGGAGLYVIASRIPLQRLGSEAASGDWAAAKASARHASDLAPWSSEPWIRLGEDALRAGRTADARAAFEQAVAAEPGEWLGWHDLAQATTGADHDAAVARATALNPLTP